MLGARLEYLGRRQRRRARHQAGQRLSPSPSPATTGVVAAGPGGLDRLQKLVWERHVTTAAIGAEVD